MNFASDNGVGRRAGHSGGDRRGERGIGAGLWRRSLTQRAENSLERNIRARPSRPFWSAPAPPPTPWRSARWRGPGAPSSATRRRISTTTNAARRNFSPAAPSSSAFPAKAARSRPTPCARRWRGFRAASSKRCSRPRCRFRRRPKPGRSIRSTRSPRLSALAHEAGVAVHHGRRAFRQRACRARLLAGGNVLAGGRRRAIFRRHQKRRDGLRGGRSSSTPTGSRISPFSASAAATRYRRAAFSARRWPPISRTGSGSNSRGAPTTRRAARRGPRRHSRTCGWPGRGRRTRCSRSRRDPSLDALRQEGAAFYEWSSRAVAPAAGGPRWRGLPAARLFFRDERRRDRPVSVHRRKARRRKRLRFNLACVITVCAIVFPS